MAPGLLCEFAANRARTGQIDTSHLRIFDELISNLAAFPRSVCNEIQDPFWKACFMENLCNDYTACCGGLHRGFENRRVSVSDRQADGSEGENQRRIPWCDTRYDTDGLADCHVQGTGEIGRNKLPACLVNLGCSLTEQARGEHCLEHGKTKGAARFLCENRNDFHLFLFKNICGLQEQRLSFRWK
ncbi:MAG: hypothetical protein A4E65_03013 [Syntrophorhabdus sp. PtaU1.Bin153]|nr:MAG: hypothetical protein A4E65_03013 [Syntrophorhabdus sp. PtaU1.Bin153]